MHCMGFTECRKPRAFLPATHNSDVHECTLGTVQTLGLVSATSLLQSDRPADVIPKRHTNVLTCHTVAAAVR